MARSHKEKNLLAETSPKLKSNKNKIVDENENILETKPSLDNSDPSIDLLEIPNNCAESVKEFAEYVWTTMSHHELPEWLKDNDFLVHGHRPELPSIKACMISWFQIHTETGNIWTHLIGAIWFILIALYTFTRPSFEIAFQEKFVFSFFFSGAIICLFFSTFYHTFSCHSADISKLWKKLDYCGISLLTMGSFVPWLYYAFFCENNLKYTYLGLILILGSACIIVSLFDKFGETEYRAIRAGMFVALGLSAVLPASHWILIHGFFKGFNVGCIGYLLVMAFLYIFGAGLYACRIPERYFPGKCDIWFQSHQIFHVCVVAAAFVHYTGVNKLISYRLSLGDCMTSFIEADFTFDF